MALSVILLEMHAFHTKFVHLWCQKIVQHSSVTATIDGNRFAVIVFKKVRSDDFLRANSTSDSDFLVELNMLVNN